MSIKKCPICLLSMFDIDVCITSCKHEFHTSCLLESYNGKCPQCSKIITNNRKLNCEQTPEEVLNVIRGGLRSTFDELLRSTFDELNKEDPEEDRFLERLKKAQEAHPEIYKPRNELFYGSKMTKNKNCKSKKK